MKYQWNLVLALLFALIVALFSLANTTPVSVNYLFGSKEIPLVLVIILSSFLGGIAIGLVSTFFYMKLKWKLYKVEKELQQRREIVDQNEVSEEINSPSEETPLLEPEQNNP
ncbi:LapA family protein [Ammoniphilus resinae]|uniref:Integral membrane protein n=1 Tax=Ammoniphilus resinae TaxID=861532 RepID=A0ABS4GRA8_9BACL|nr:LapA family protein [Ammoniphilus resinae]MBP1932791.1 putative integral membrane protein [Ammoniphilus resinae]